MNIKVAIAQINYLPAYLELDRTTASYISYEKSPFLYNELTDASSTFRDFKKFTDKHRIKKREITTYIDNFYNDYSETLLLQIAEIINICKKEEVKLIVFPEYSIPKNILTAIKDLADRNEITIIAGTHAVIEDDIENHYLAELLKPKFTSSTDVLAICPIFRPHEPNQILFKEFSSRLDPNIKEVNDSERDTICVNINGQQVKIGVAICKEFLPSMSTEESYERLKQVLNPLQEADIICLVSLNKDSSFFIEKTTQFIHERRHGGRINILYSNYSLFGGSYIQTKGDEIRTDKSSKELLLIREIIVGTGGGRAFESPNLPTKVLTLIPKTNVSIAFEKILDSIESKDVQIQAKELKGVNLPNCYKNLLEIVIGHIDSGSINKSRLSKIVSESSFFLESSKSVSFLLSSFFDTIKQYIDKDLDPSYESANDLLISKLKSKIQKLREHGVIIDYNENTKNILPTINTLPEIEYSKKSNWDKFVDDNIDAEFQFGIRITSVPNEDAGIAYQVRLVAQLIEFLDNIPIIEYFESRIITHNDLEESESQLTHTEIFLMFKFQSYEKTTLAVLCQELYITLNNRMPVINIEPIEITSLWFKDFGFVKNTRKKTYITPKTIDNKRYSFTGRGEISSVIKMLSALKGSNSFNIRIFSKAASNRDKYEVNWEEDKISSSSEGNIQANAMTTLRDLQDLQDAATTLKFDFPLFSPNSGNGETTLFSIIIWFETSLFFGTVAEDYINKVVVSSFAHEIAGIGRFKLDDKPDEKFVVSESEMFHLIRLPFGKIPGFGSRSDEAKELSYDTSKYPNNEEGLFLGNVPTKNKSGILPYHWDKENRERHMYVIGKTGTGKSYFLSSLISRDILNNGSLMVIDPHGDLIDTIIKRIPENRVKDLIYFDPGDSSFAPGLNLFEADYESEAHKSFVIEEAVSIFLKLYGAEIFGPRIQHYFREALVSLMEYRRIKGEFTTLLDVSKIFIDKDFQNEVRNAIKDKGIARDFWLMFDSQNDRERQEMLPYFQAKFGQLVSNYVLKNVVGQQKSMINFYKVINEPKIILVNLSKGKLRDLNSNLLGMILVSKLNYAIMSRASLNPTERKLFTLYVDEFQNFASSTFASMLSEARKYKLSMVLANQYLNQLKLYDAYQNMYPDSLIESVLGNCGTITSFRISDHDATIIGAEMQIGLRKDQANPLVELNNYEAIVSTTSLGKKMPPFKLKSSLWDGADDFNNLDFIETFKKSNCKNLSTAKFSTKTVRNRKVIVQNLNFSEVVEEIRNDENKSHIVEDYEDMVGAISANIFEEKWYIEYISKFYPIDKEINVPELWKNDFDWDLLLQLTAGSLSSSLKVELNKENKIDCTISVDNDGNYVTKKLEELYPFQISNLFRIYIEENLNFQTKLSIPLADGNNYNEVKEIEKERNSRLEKWGYQLSQIDG